MYICFTCCERNTDCLKCKGVRECFERKFNIYEPCKNCGVEGNVMDRLIVLVGPSGSGKTTLGYELERQGIGKVVDTYTTRPPRYEGEKGHIFADLIDYLHTHKEELLAETDYNGYLYWTVRSQYQDQGTTIWIVDVNGVKCLREKVKDAEIVVIYLQCDEDERWERLWARAGEITSDEHYSNTRKHINERKYHDREAFKLVPCDYVIDANKELDEVVELVKEIIKEGQRMCREHDWVKGKYMGEPAKICTICGLTEMRWEKRVIWYSRRYGRRLAV